MNYKPTLPFEGYKWLFATKAPTEALGDPAVLLGLISRVSKIENGSLKYSSDQFAQILHELDRDIKTTVSLSSRTGERNLMRNSGQYWKLFGLIPQESTHGVITLTHLARKIASGHVSQVDFAASTIVTMKLPNVTSYSITETAKWKNAKLCIHPLRLILQIIRELYLLGCEAYLTVDELAKVVVPMAGDKKSVSEIASYILRFRENPSIVSDWPDCTPRSNDVRFLGEFLRFLVNFGYLTAQNITVAQGYSKTNTRYTYIPELDCQIESLIDGTWSENSTDLIELIKNSGISGMVTMSNISRQTYRPGQQKFRANILDSLKRCPITGVDLPEVLQAAHIKPYAFGGSQEIDNGLPLRADIHCLFDSGLLNINPISSNRICRIELANESVRSNYREFDNKFIELPEITSIENIRWRYDNHLLGVV